jgi:hypothetical protein
VNCPACGVAVLPGYARCPKCHASLPQRAQTNVEGGTALEPPRSIPLPAVIAVGVLGLGLIIWLGVRGGGKKHDEPPPKITTTPGPAATQQPVQPAPTPGVAVAPPTRPSGPNADELAADLERTLKRQRLWSTVSVTGSRVDIRGGACGDAAIQAPIAASAAGFKAAGLTTLRCVEQSGAVVFTREL